MCVVWGLGRISSKVLQLRLSLLPPIGLAFAIYMKGGDGGLILQESREVMSHRSVQYEPRDSGGEGVKRLLRVASLRASQGVQVEQVGDLSIPC